METILDRNSADLPTGVEAVEAVKQVGARRCAATHLTLARLAAAASHAIHPGAQIQNALGGGNLTRPGPRGQQQGRQGTCGHHRLDPGRTLPRPDLAITRKHMAGVAGHGLESLNRFSCANHAPNPRGML